MLCFIFNRRIKIYAHPPVSEIRSIAAAEGNHPEMSKNVPYLITPRPSHIPHPLDTTIITLLKHLQIPHQQPTTRKHQQRKTQIQRGARPRLLVGHTRQRGVRTHDIFTLPREPGDFPDNVVLAGLVLGLALAGARGDAGGVERRGDPDDDVGGEELAAVVGADGYLVFDFGFAEFVDDGVDPEGEVDVFGGAVSAVGGGVSMWGYSMGGGTWEGAMEGDEWG